MCFKTFRHYCSFILQRSIAELISEARRGYMGYLWWVVEPVLYMAVFYVVFVVVFHRGGEHAVAFLLVGLVSWKWFASSIPKSSNAVLANAGLIRQVYMPKIVFPFTVLMTSSIKFLIVFCLLLGFLILTGMPPNAAWVGLPLIMLVQLLVMLAIGCILASIVPFLPDLKLVIENGMTFLLFMSGIFFDISTVSPTMQKYLYLNPMTGIIESFRHVLLNGLYPDFVLLGKLAFFACMGIVLGAYLLFKFDRVYVKIM